MRPDLVVARDASGVYRLVQGVEPTPRIVPPPVIRRKKRPQQTLVVRPRQTIVDKVEAKIAAALQMGEANKEAPEATYVRNKLRRPLLRPPSVQTVRERKISLDEAAIMDRTLRTVRRVRRVRSAETARTIARLVRYLESDRLKTWLRVASFAKGTRVLLRILERHRALRKHERIVRATVVIARFLRYFVRPRVLQRAVDCIRHTATMLQAQFAFRKACKHLFFSIVQVQRFYRRRARRTRAYTTLLRLQWDEWLDANKASARKLSTNRRKQQEVYLEPVGVGVQQKLLVEFIRRRRQEHTLRLIVYQRYDLRPYLMEALRCKYASRFDLRCYLDDCQKYGTLSTAPLNIDAPPPPSPPSLLMSRVEIKKLQDAGKSIISQ